MIIYLAVFQAANVVGGYTAEHFYIKGKSEAIRLHLFDTPDNNLAGLMEKIKPKHDEVPTQWLDVSINPPSLSALLLNAVLSGERVGQIIYFVLDAQGKAIESGSYIAGDYQTGATKPL